MEKRKLELLKKLEEFFKNDDDVEEVSMFSSEELGIPVDMLRLLLTEYGPGLIDIFAEYTFIPVPGPDEVWYFSSIITIMTDIPKEGAVALAGAIARLNFYLPYGAFCLSSDGDMLIYKTVSALRADHDDQKLYEDIELAADTALLVPERYSYLLMQVAEGELLLNDFINSLPE